MKCIDDGGLEGNCKKWPNNMTPSQQAKAAGLKSLLQVSELTGVRTQTLNNWAKNKPKLFRTVMLGAMKIQEIHDGV